MLSEREMVGKTEKSAPLRAIDWRNKRLSKGVYCVEIEGIPYSNVYLASLDRESRESEDQIVCSPSTEAWSIMCSDAFLGRKTELRLWVGTCRRLFERCAGEIFEKFEASLRHNESYGARRRRSSLTHTNSRSQYYARKGNRDLEGLSVFCSSIILHLRMTAHLITC